jgi:hypothetical protein
MATATRTNLDKPMQDLGNQMQQGAQEAKDQAGNMMETATQKAKDAASYVGDKAEQATGAVGSGMESLADTIRSHTPATGTLHRAGEAVADSLQSGGHYLEDHGLSGMGKDLTQFVRKNPIPALLMGVGLGFILARMVRR